MQTRVFVDRMDSGIRLDRANYLPCSISALDARSYLIKTGPPKLWPLVQDVSDVPLATTTRNGQRTYSAL